MQAILFKGLNQPLQLGTVATPVPAADEVLIEVCTVSYTHLTLPTKA